MLFYEGCSKNKMDTQDKKDIKMKWILKQKNEVQWINKIVLFNIELTSITPFIWVKK